MAFGLQQRVPVVGFVGFATIEIVSATLVPIRRAMDGLGYVEGLSIIVEARPPSATLTAAPRRRKARSHANGGGVAARTVALIRFFLNTWIKSDAVSAEIGEGCEKAICAHDSADPDLA